MDFVRKDKGDAGAIVRQRIMAATFDVMRQDKEVPDPENIAKKSGLSVDVVRSSYSSLVDLAVDIGLVTEASYQPLYDAMPEPGEFPQMLEDLVALRVDLYETVAPTRVFADGAEYFIPGAKERKAVREGRYRSRLMEMLLPHFGSRTDEVASQIELLTSWESWRHLRFVQCLSEDQARSALQALVARCNDLP
jgi:hypothetical protein